MPKKKRLTDNHANRSKAKYEQHKTRTGKRHRVESAKGRDIGPIPPPENPRRRAACALDLRKHIETYHAEVLELAWSPDHIRMIEGIQRAALQGGLQAIGMPRGFAKTTICEFGAEWVLLHGHRNFAMLVGAEMESAVEMLLSIRTDMETNDLLAADFPEVCVPIAALEGINQRAAGQTINGERTHIAWTGKSLRLPMVSVADWKKSRALKGFVGPGGMSLASGAIVKVAGIMGRIRGTKHKRADGKNARPDFALIDDPQTDESAASPDQCDKRERLMSGAILGLAGPGKSIAALATVTVIRKGDMADRILDRAKHPEWHGERSRMVLSFPTKRNLWDEYAELRKAAMRSGAIECVTANEFYSQHRAEMDLGAVVSWPERKLPGDLSGIQHAMNLLIDRGERVFMAEYQLDPIPEASEAADALSADEIAKRLNRTARGVVPPTATALTAFIDVQGLLLPWVVMGWEPGFGGFVVDYGSEPDQGTAYWSAASAKRTLQQAASGAGMEGAIYAGLDRLCNRIMDREWKRSDGVVMRIGRCLIDAGWGISTNTVYRFCRQTKHAAIVMPSKGRGIGASSLPMGEWQSKPGERHGDNWIVRPEKLGNRSIPLCLFDANHWKSFVAARYRATIGDPGAITLFGASPDVHRMFADHAASEYPVRTSGRGREVDEWKLRPNCENHLGWDGVIGCAVAASMLGITIKGADAGGKKRRSIREMYDAAKNRRSA